MKLLAINGSPTKDGTVQRLLEEILASAGQPDQIIHLRDYNIKPCMGCRACVRDNICIQNDDWNQIVDQLQEADRLAIGIPTYYGAAFGVNALTHNFLERWFALRHNGLKMNAKQAVAVVSSGEGQGALGLQSLKDFLEMYHGIELIDSVIASGVTPCYVCGEGEDCVMSAARAKHGETLCLKTLQLPSLELQPEVIKKAIEIGRKLKLDCVSAD